jgi:circadian clock protein KaiB
MEATFLRLYVCGQSPKSVRAISRLDQLRHAAGNRELRIEIVDVLEDPERVLEDRVPITPALVRVAPHPPVRVVGEINDLHHVVSALGWLDGQ